MDRHLKSSSWRLWSMLASSGGNEKVLGGGLAELDAEDVVLDLLEDALLGDCALDDDCVGLVGAMEGAAAPGKLS